MFAVKYPRSLIFAFSGLGQENTDRDHDDCLPVRHR